MKYFPIFIDLKNKRSVVIGGGEVALRKVKDLLHAGALVTIIAPRLHDELASLCGSNPLHVSREYCEGDLDGAVLAFSATDDSETNRRVFQEAQKKGIWLNSVDDPEHCSFIVPSSFSRDDLIVAVSTSGASPSYAAKLRRIIEASIPSNTEETLAALKEARNILKNDIRFASLSSAQRGNLLKKISSDDNLIATLLKHKKDDTIADFLKGLL
jgi:siroheme synthase-like protein